MEDIIDKLFSPAFPPFLSFEVVDQQNYSPDRQPVRLPPQIHSWLTKLAVPLLTLVGFPATDAPSAPGDTGATLDGRRWRPLIFEQPLFEGLRALLGGQVGIEPAADVIQALRDWGGTVAARVRLLRRGSAAELTDVINAFWKVGPPLPCYLATSGAADSTSPTGPVPVSTTLRLSMYQALLAVRLETLDTVANAGFSKCHPLAVDTSLSANNQRVGVRWYPICRPKLWHAHTATLNASGGADWEWSTKRGTRRRRAPCLKKWSSKSSTELILTRTLTTAIVIRWSSFSVTAT